jgi:tRNA dimethylallyltransferase
LPRIKSSNTYQLIVILGPTASGKTKLATALAHQLHTHIISADSRQVYKQLNIGTGKDYEDYVVNNQAIPYHLIDVAEAGSKYHIHQFKHDFFAVFNALQQQGVIPILCGGTGLYIQAVLQQFEFTSIPNNMALRERLHTLSYAQLLAEFLAMPQTLFSPKADTSTAKRLIRAIEINDFLLNHAFTPNSQPQINALIFGLNPEVEQRNQNIEKRLKQRLKNGLIDEVKDLLKQGIDPEQLIYYGLEYKFVTQYLQGVMTYEALEELLNIAIRQFAKRQMTYFRKMEKDGLPIHWIDPDLILNEQVQYIQHTLQQA